MTVIAGIDPGNSGAIAFLDTAKATLKIYDMPTFEFETTKKRVTIDPYAIVAFMQQYKLGHVYMEEVFSSPQMGVVSAFNFGEGKGMIKGVAAALGYRSHRSSPRAGRRK